MSVREECGVYSVKGTTHVDWLVQCELDLPRGLFIDKPSDELSRDLLSHPSLFVLFVHGCLYVAAAAIVVVKSGHKKIIKMSNNVSWKSVEW